MFDQVDNQLAEWIKEVEDKIEVTFVPPDGSSSQTSVFLHLLDVAPNLTGRGDNRTPLQIILRYLIVPFAEEPRESH